MKRIVILCDGTWNAAESAWPTNVVRLGQALAPVGLEGCVQVPIYVEGVGTGRRGVTSWTRAADRILGGLLGFGLMANVVEAYRHLVFLYEPGDEVFVFGFSRGAFTARSLIGFIRFNGLLARDGLAHLPEAARRYSERRIESPERRQRRNAEWRARFAPWFLVDPGDAPIYGEYDATSAVPFDIAFLGVWDTVGALGVPGHFTAAPFLNRRYTFHDTDLTPMVRAARHAVALDEKRKAFRPTLWTNLRDLNAGHADPRYLQEHFAGDHGSVGGGGDITGLSAIALDWMMAGAGDAGLEFDPMVAAAIRAEMDPMGPLGNRTVPAGRFTRLTRRFGAWRDPVARFEDVSRPARRRWAFEAKTAGFEPYRPGPLAGLAADLDAWRDTAETTDIT